MVTSTTTSLTKVPASAKNQACTQQLPFQPINQVLEREYSFVVSLAWYSLKGIAVNSRWEVAQELVQEAFLKYCRIARKDNIIYPRTYLRKTVHSLVIDSSRHKRMLVSLQVDEQGELTSGTVISGTCSDLQDPADIVIQKLSFRDCLETIIPVIIQTLSPGEFRAIVARMKDVVDDLQALEAAFQRYDVDISLISWPTDKRALQSSRSLLCLAQKKMRLLKPSYAHLL